MLKLISSFAMTVAALTLFGLPGKETKVAVAEVKVEGICGMCKERIESAAILKGVKSAVWDVNTRVLKVVYRKDKVTLEAIEKSIAGVGHDTEHQKATEEAYSKVHHCCKYRHQSAH